MARTWLTEAATRVAKSRRVGRRLGSASTTRSASPRTSSAAVSSLGEAARNSPATPLPGANKHTRTASKHAVFVMTEPKHQRLSTDERRLSTRGFPCVSCFTDRDIP